MQGCAAVSFRPSSNPESQPDAPRFNRDSTRREPQGSSRNSCVSRAALETTEEVLSMCDYSLQNVKSRPARVGEKLRTQHFDTGTIGFAAPEDSTTAVWVLPGT